MVIIAVDADDARAVDGGVQNFRGPEIDGHKDAGIESELRALRGDSVGEVAGGRTANLREAEAARGGQGRSTTRSLKESVGKQTASFLK